MIESRLYMLSILCSSLITLGIKTPPFYSYLNSLGFSFQISAVPVHYQTSSHSGPSTLSSQHIFTFPSINSVTLLSCLLRQISLASCALHVLQFASAPCRERGAAVQDRLWSRFSPGILNTQPKSCCKALLALFPSVLLCVTH